MGNQIDRECPICGRVYPADTVRLSWGRQTTCSRKCSYALRAQQMERRVEGLCATCGQEFTRPPSHVKGKYGSQFCSPGCHYAARALGLTKRIVTQPYRYTDQTRGILSRAAALAYASGKTLPHPQTEIAACGLLARHGVAFIHQHVIDLPNGRSIAVDFLLHRRGLIIEIDGPFHGRHTDRDAERDSLLSGLGYTVLRIPDDGVPEHVARAVLLAAVN